jgi:hypothetical protein
VDYINALSTENSGFPSTRGERDSETQKLIARRQQVVVSSELGEP